MTYGDVVTRSEEYLRWKEEYEKHQTAMAGPATATTQSPYSGAVEEFFAETVVGSVVPQERLAQPGRPMQR